MKPAPPVTSTRSPIGRRICGSLRPATTVALLGGLAALAAACGGGGFRRAAEPAAAPPLTREPAGRTRAIGGEPEGLAFDAAAGLLAVGLRQPHGALAFVDPDTLATRARVPLPAAPRHLAYAPAEAAVLVPAESADRVLEVTPDGVRSRSQGRHPPPRRRRDRPPRLRRRRALRPGLGPAPRPARSDLAGAAPAGRDRRLRPPLRRPRRRLRARPAGLRRRQRRASWAQVDAGVGPTHVVGSGYVAFVADTEGDAVRKFAVGAHPVQTEVVPAPGAPYGIAVDHARGRLWVTLTARNQLVEYAVGEGPTRRIATYPTVRQPNSVAVDPRSGVVFVAGRRDGRLQRIVPREDRP